MVNCGVPRHRWGFLARRLARGETLVVVAVAAGIAIEKLQSLNGQPEFRALVRDCEAKLRMSDEDRSAYRRQLIEDGELSLLELRHVRTILAAVKELRKNGAGLERSSRSSEPEPSKPPSAKFAAASDPLSADMSNVPDVPDDDWDPFADYVPKALMGQTFDDGAFDDAAFDDAAFDDVAFDEVAWAKGVAFLSETSLGLDVITEADLGARCGDRPRRLKTFDDSTSRSEVTSKSHRRPQASAPVSDDGSTETVEAEDDIVSFDGTLVSAASSQEAPVWDNPVADKPAGLEPSNGTPWHKKASPAHHKRGPPG